MSEDKEKKGLPPIFKKRVEKPKEEEPKTDWENDEQYLFDFDNTIYDDPHSD